MIAPRDFFGFLRERGIGPFVGVPCSLLSSPIAYAVDHPEEVEHFNPPHESQAVAFAAGAFMATGKLPMVYLQNSGLGNIMNPLTSLSRIYDIPCLLLITWRAEKGYGDDAPEHWIMGEDMEKFLTALKLPYRVLSPETWQKDIRSMEEEAKKTSKPVVLVVKKGLFEAYERSEKPGNHYVMTGAEAIALVKTGFPDAAFLSTTGIISRESFTVNDTPDFYMMGSMGLIASIAAGVAQYRVAKKIVALDGDGAALMHLGTLPFIGHQKYANLVHVIIDNESYSSTKGQPTVSPSVDFPLLARASGYREALSVQTADELQKSIAICRNAEGPILILIKVRSGHTKNIPRISDTYTCPQVKERFMNMLGL